jgi:hypothetical protein
VLCSRKLLLIFCSSREVAALHDAVVNGHMKVCELLIANKADVNAKNKCAVMFEFATD